MEKLFGFLKEFYRHIRNSPIKTALFVVFAIVFYYWVVGYKYSDNIWGVNIDDSYIVSHSDAQIIAQKFVKQNLKSPSTADFPWDEDAYDIVEKESDRWLVRSYVDAQNGFGATVRHKWWVEMKYKKATDKWELMNIAIY